MKDNTLLNEQIRAHEVRLIGEDGEALGIMPTREALKIANDSGLDLVLISPNATPPVCKVMNYSKFRYQNEKKQKEAKKKQKQIEVKEIKLSTQIAQNDIDYKVRHAIEFFKSGKQVKFKVFLQRREMDMKDAGVSVLQKVASMVEGHAVAEKAPAKEGRFLVVLYVPAKSGGKAGGEKPAEKSGERGAEKSALAAAIEKVSITQQANAESSADSARS